MPRPRGFIADWRPQKKTRALIEHVKSVLAEYESYLPLTLRQIFYRLVGKNCIEKTEKSYSSLCETLNRARRAEIIAMDAIRDDGFSGGTATRIGYTGTAEFREEMRWHAQTYKRDRQAGQERRIVLWCEAAGMVPQLQAVAGEFGVTVKSSGGFDSLTAKHGIGRAFDGVTILHVGDYDPSGECMFDALAEDVIAFGTRYEHDIAFHRLAVTPAQIAEHNLPTAPPKASTHQARKAMSETTQAEALDPATLAAIVEYGITTRMDQTVYRQVVKAEEAERAALIERWEAA